MFFFHVQYVSRCTSSGKSNVPSILHIQWSTVSFTRSPSLLDTFNTENRISIMELWKSIYIIFMFLQTFSLIPFIPCYNLHFRLTLRTLFLMI